MNWSINFGDDWLLWQLADSAFPTGGFAHSGGLEAAWQHGEVRNRDELSTFIEASLSQFGHGSFPLMLAAHQEPGRFSELDRLCESFTTNHVANRASRLQGQALLSSAQRIFGISTPQNLCSSDTQSPPCCHLAPTFGFVLHFLDVGRKPASRLFFFLHLRGLLAGAVRLGIVGPMEAQAIQRDLAPRAEAVMIRYQNIGVDEIAQTAPLLELWQGSQDRLYSRLFQS
jgi:urease accessory protein